MCGIAGLFVKDHSLEGDLGALLAGMLSPLSDRGPDSAGFAVYGAETAGDLKFTLRAPAEFDLDPVLKSLSAAVGEKIGHRYYDTHIVVSLPAGREAPARHALASFPDVAVVGTGQRMEIFKEVG